jgi:signal transduction histidine kinase
MKKAMALIVVSMFIALMGATMVFAGEAGTKEEAVAMVKKAVEFIKANGNEKAFAEFSNPKSQFVDRDLYIVVYDMTAKCLAHGQKASMVGKDLIDFKDVDGKEYMKERVDMMQKQNSGWQDYKFMNPVSKQIEPKSMYLERSGDLIVGCGVYKK